jgi:chemotaxis protein histidine kinase CheA
VSIETEKSDDDFQKELVELFGQEAHEWLLQIDSALAELENQPNVDRHIQLVEAVVRGITSLGGSAATVNLAEVERTTFALLPFIDTLKDRTTTTKQDFTLVREQFWLVVTSVTMATGITLNISPPSPPAARTEPSVGLLTLLNALHALQEDQAVNGQSVHSLVPQVMQRLEQEARSGAEQIQATHFYQILQELQQSDAQCLKSLRLRLPAVGHSLARLRTEGLPALEPGNTLGECIDTLAHLQSIAKQAHAIPLVTFFTGLQNFISLVLRHRLSLTAQRVQAVEMRIRAVLATIEEWITAGEHERDTMGRLLPVG